MFRARPDDVARPPASVVAQLMLQCTRDDPTLVKRSRGHTRTAQTPAVQTQAMLSPVTRPELRPSPMLLSNGDLATKQYFEDLVSIAVTSSERADDLLREANKASRKATYAAWAFASIAAVSVAAGAAGMIASHHGSATDNRLTEIAGEVKSLGRQQQQASRQLAAVRSEIADGHPATVTAQQTTDPAPTNTQGAIPAATLPMETPPMEMPPVETSPMEMPPVKTIPVETLPATAIQPTQPFGATPAIPVQQATYSWPRAVYHHPRRPARTVQRRRIPVPRFLVVFQQNLRTLFR
jgi:hypothetical protein